LHLANLDLKNNCFHQWRERALLVGSSRVKKRRIPDTVKYLKILEIFNEIIPNFERSKIFKFLWWHVNNFDNFNKKWKFWDFQEFFSIWIFAFNFEIFKSFSILRFSSHLQLWHFPVTFIFFLIFFNFQGYARIRNFTTLGWRLRYPSQ